MLDFKNLTTSFFNLLQINPDSQEFTDLFGKLFTKKGQYFIIHEMKGIQNIRDFFINDSAANNITISIIDSFVDIEKAAIIGSVSFDTPNGPVSNNILICAKLDSLQWKIDSFNALESIYYSDVIIN